MVLGSIVACNPFATPCLTANEENYATTFLDHGNRYTEELGILGGLLVEAEIENEEWRADVDTQIATLGLLYDEALEIEPPSSMTHIHDKYLQAMYHFDTAMDLLTEGIDTENPDLLDEAVLEIELGNEDFEECTTLYDDFIAARCP